jgi:hypothetical protein
MAQEQEEYEVDNNDDDNDDSEIHKPNITGSKCYHLLLQY